MIYLSKNAIFKTVLFHTLYYHHGWISATNASLIVNDVLILRFSLISLMDVNFDPSWFWNCNVNGLLGSSLIINGQVADY